MKSYQKIIRWIARILGSALFLLVLAFIIGEGYPNPLKLTASELISMIAFLMMLIGIPLAWKWEGLGGLIMLIGFIIFWIVNYLGSHRVGVGWVFPIFPIVGILFLFSSWRTKSPASQ
jgi:hypothetical protein